MLGFSLDLGLQLRLESLAQILGLHLSFRFKALDFRLGIKFYVQNFGFIFQAGILGLELSLEFRFIFQTLHFMLNFQVRRTTLDFRFQILGLKVRFRFYLEFMIQVQIVGLDFRLIFQVQVSGLDFRFQVSGLDLKLGELGGPWRTGGTTRGN